MTSRRRPWVGPLVVVLGVFALLGGAGFLHVLVTMAALWWLLTRTGSRGRHAAQSAAPVQAPPMRRSPTPPMSDAGYWPVLPAAAGAAAAWYATRETEPGVTGWDEEDEEACADELNVAVGGWHEPVEETAGRVCGSGAWADATDDFGGSGGGGDWRDGFGGYGGGGDWGDDFGGHGGGGGWDDD